jgi:hypothetical protein
MKEENFNRMDIPKLTIKTPPYDRGMHDEHLNTNRNKRAGCNIKHPNDISAT